MMLDQDVAAVSPSTTYRVLSAAEKFPEARPRIISDNGPHFIAKDFKEFIRIAGMTHVPMIGRLSGFSGSR